MSNAELDRQLAALRASYAERLPARVAALATTAADLAGRWDATEALELQRHLHNLAGSGASYGFPEISRAARAAEETCAAALAAGAAPSLDGLRDAIAALGAAAAQVRA